MMVLDEIREMVTARGSGLYGGEAVTQEQHALQCATLAEADGASDALIVAALLHDIGHLIDDEFGSASNEDADRHHENRGRDYLAGWFGPEVTEPVRLHVDAKRFLCATKPRYFETLSPASVLSLELQGGPFNDDEAKAFASLTYGTDAVKLRRWDDLAKDTRVITPELEHFLSYIERIVRPDAAA